MSTNPTMRAYEERRAKQRKRVLIVKIVFLIAFVAAWVVIAAGP